MSLSAALKLDGPKVLLEVLDANAKFAYKENKEGVFSSIQTGINMRGNSIMIKEKVLVNLHLKTEESSLLKIDI